LSTRDLIERFLRKQLRKQLETALLVLPTCFSTEMMEMLFENRHTEKTASGRRTVLALDSPAKINLFLEIHGKRSDGFHDLETLMTTVSLADRIAFSPRTDGEIRLAITGETGLVFGLPTDQRNLVVQALQLLKNSAGDASLGCDVQLHKRIPPEAGLGGASSNAAVALRAGNQIWQLGYSGTRLLELAAELGSDVPFFLGSSTALCRGRGELIEPVPLLPAGIPLVIAMPRTGLSTRLVFSRVVVPEQPRGSGPILASLSAGDWISLGSQLFNRLQPIAASLNPEIDRLSRLFQETFPVGHLMSGSGSSYFGIYGNTRQAIRATRVLSSRAHDVVLFPCWTGRSSGGLVTAELTRR
jgi:4-diphosphocytidyl-2-C-methyl-D-erythritol kinase